MIEGNGHWDMVIDADGKGRDGEEVGVLVVTGLKKQMEKCDEREKRGKNKR